MTIQNSCAMTPSRHERGGGGGEYRHPLNARCSRQADQRNTRWWTLDISTNSQSYHHEDFSGHPRSSPDLGLRAFTDAAERLSSKPSRGSKRRDPVSSASRRWTHVDGSILAIAVVEGGKFMGIRYPNLSLKAVPDPHCTTETRGGHDRCLSVFCKDSIFLTG